MSETKDKILITALKLFAERGFEAVSVSDIAQCLSVTKGALYRHYESKQAIFDSILALMENDDLSRSRDFGVPEAPIFENERTYADSSLEQLVKFGEAQLRYWTAEEIPSNFRRMLTLEQYHGEKMSELYKQYFTAGPLEYVTDILQSHKIAEPRVQAIQFYAPMLLFYSLCDCAEDKQSVYDYAREHFESFCRKWKNA